MRTSHFARIPSGFTLIEVLVVISIIALLVAILLPSLAKAREAGRSAVCGSRVRQYGIATFMYIDENKDWTPGGGGDIWDPSQYQWYGVWGGATYAATWQYQIQRYIEPFRGHTENTIWSCPSISPAAGYYFGGDMRTPPWSHFGITTRMTVLSGGGKAYRMTRIQPPSAKILIGDSDTYIKYSPNILPRVFYGLSDYPVISNRHGNGANTVWFDGHTKRLGADDPVAIAVTNMGNWATQAPAWEP
ncbi:MAG: prepilin-type N-terminal cleavage/methylation domain-containing protein [Phycisphaeraceae bacterium]|nr:prepilin-type N-terminal cleavage/methylation domain-containing protein [Phycisphaeraceae bacterium]